MRKPESKITIFLGNLFLVSFIIVASFWYWTNKMYAVGMSVEFYRVIPIVIIIILIPTSLLTWVTWKITKGKF